MSFGVYVLSGTEADEAALTDFDDGAGATSVSLTVERGGFVASATGTFSGNPTTRTATPAPTYFDDSGNGRLAIWENTTAGAHQFATSGSDGAAVMAYFAPAAAIVVPEPSSLALLGLSGGLLIVRRRCKA